MWYFLPVTKSSKSSPSEEQNDKDSVQDGSNNEGDADDNFQDNKNEQVIIFIQ